MPTPPQPSRRPRNPDTLARDRDLVERLVQLDDDAWKIVLKEMILPALWNTLAWKEMLDRLLIPPEAVATQVAMSLLARDCKNLRAFRFESSLSSYVRDWTRAAMSAIKKHYECRPPVNGNPEGKDMETLPWRPPSPREVAAARARLETGNRHLSVLWHANPPRALVLILRNAHGLRSKRVAEILGLSPDNVDQIHKRATAHLLKIVKKGSPGDA